MYKDLKKKSFTKFNNKKERNNCKDIFNIFLNKSAFSLIGYDLFSVCYEAFILIWHAVYSHMFMPLFIFYMLEYSFDTHLYEINCLGFINYVWTFILEVSKNRDEVTNRTVNNGHSLRK